VVFVALVSSHVPAQHLNNYCHYHPTCRRIGAVRTRAAVCVVVVRPAATATPAPSVLPLLLRRPVRFHFLAAALSRVQVQTQRVRRRTGDVDETVVVGVAVGGLL